MTIHTVDGQQKKTKLECIGLRAIHRKETVFNNIGHAIDRDLLIECYQELDGQKAIGRDGVTKRDYSIKLEENLLGLLGRIRNRAYNPQASRIVEIPKEDGSTRPLAISCFEDKVVKLAVSKILTAVFEPQFLDCSYGYRKGINAHDALRALMKHSNQFSKGATLEIDLQQYFNSIPHDKLLGILREKIVEKRFLKLIEKLIRAPVVVNGKPELNRVGCPQGSIISPILSNIYLHYVIDSWVEELSRNHFKGKAKMVRFCDDMVFVFERSEDAERFQKVLPKRLEKYGLKLHETKSSLIKSGSDEAKAAEQRGERLQTYKFLGFTCYWGKSRNGRWRLKYKSRADRFTAKLKGLRTYLRKSLNQDTRLIITQVKQVIRGWGNYHSISDNKRRVNAFIHMSKRALYTWVNRKGGRRKMNWATLGTLLKAMKYPENFKTTSMFNVS